MADTLGVDPPPPYSFPADRPQGATTPAVSLSFAPTGPVLAQQIGVRTRAASSYSPPPVLATVNALYGSRVWGSRGERPKHERDSLRSRSKEGRPGSRKHRRWTRSQELVSSLRRAMAACGEDTANPEATDRAIANQVHEAPPSAFYQLLENEGPGHALDALAAAEARRRCRSPRAPRRKDDAQLADERERTVRRAFSETWQFVQGSANVRELISQLESNMASAFGAPGTDEPAANPITPTPPAAQPAAPSDKAEEAQETKADEPKGTDVKENAAALWCDPTQVAGITLAEELDAASTTWLLSWDGTTLTTEEGMRGPAVELAVMGLTPTQRKVIHTVVRVLGLVSESRTLDEVLRGKESAIACNLTSADGDGKVLTIRPPRTGRPYGGVGTWVAPFSVARTLAMVAA